MPPSDTRTASSPHSTKSVITKPQNVCVMRDIMCSGYVAGGNTRWFGAPRNNVFDTGATATNGDVQDHMAQRLSFEDDAVGEYASMMAFASPLANEMASARDQVISISDRLLPWEVSKNSNPEKSYFPGGADGYDRYKGKWLLGSVHFGEDTRATESMSFMSQVRSDDHARSAHFPYRPIVRRPIPPLSPQGAVNNAMCFLGPHRKYNPFAQNFFELVPGQGHFGPDAIPGDVSFRLEQHASSCRCIAHTVHFVTHRRAGAAASRCRSSRREILWSRSRWRRTHNLRYAQLTTRKTSDSLFG